MSRALRPRSIRRLVPSIWVRPRAERVARPARPACFVAAQGVWFPAALALILAVVGIAVEVSRFSLPPEFAAWVQVARSFGGIR
jgi:hypothetical protein